MCYTLCALGAVASILAYGAYEQRSERTHFEPSTAELDRIQSQWYFFAANFHNNAAVLVQQIPIYLSLFSTLGDRNVFVSVFENGSKDDTHRLLREFAAELRARGIKHHIVLSATSSWNADGHLANVTMAQRIAFMARVRNAALLPLLQSVTAADDSKRIVKSLQQTSGNVAAAALAAAGLVGTGKGTAAGAAGAKNSAAAAPPTQDEAERTAPSVPDMEAWLRKHASEIISSSTDSPWTAAAQASSSAAKATEQQSQSASASTVASMTDYAAHAFAEFERQQHGGKVGTGKVLFVNDVFFSESDALRLIETRNGDYDMACAMDFDLVKLYDTWVARDLEVCVRDPSCLCQD